MGSMEDIAAELQDALRKEFAAVRVQLDKLAHGQVVLTGEVEKINDALQFGRASEGPRMTGGNGSSARVNIGSSVLGSRNASEFASDDEEYQHRMSKFLEEKKGEMRRLLSINRANTIVMRKSLQQQKSYFGCLVRCLDESYFACLGQVTRAHIDLILDEVFTACVVLNTIFIGISADYWNGEINGFYYVDILFFVIFLMEFVLKGILHGFCGQFFGKHGLSNSFDFLLVLFDSIQIVLVWFVKSAHESMKNSGVPSVSMFRIVRVLRIARILRLLRHPVFEELLAMFEAVFTGMGTLVWAVVLFFMVVYAWALLCKDVFGNASEYQDIYPYFKTVPRSVFTVFRCSFGDCSTANGTPIPEMVHRDYGSVYSVFYCSALFFMAIGLFNVISAIFVDRTMARASRLEAKRNLERLSDDTLWATRVSTIVKQCLLKVRASDEATILDDPCVLQMELPRDVVDTAFRSDKQVMGALSDLGIDALDHSNLAAILDHDNSGFITIHKLINGLQHMRGLPRRSDVVINTLMLEALQAKMYDVHQSVTLKKSMKGTVRMQTTNFSAVLPTEIHDKVVNQAEARKSFSL